MGCPMKRQPPCDCLDIGQSVVVSVFIGVLLMLSVLLARLRLRVRAGLRAGNPVAGATAASPTNAAMPAKTSRYAKNCSRYAGDTARIASNVRATKRLELSGPASSAGCAKACRSCVCARRSRHVARAVSNRCSTEGADAIPGAAMSAASIDACFCDSKRRTSANA